MIDVAFYFVRNSRVTLLEVVGGNFCVLFFMCSRPLSVTRAFLSPLPTRLLCLVVLLCSDPTCMLVCACLCIEIVCPGQHALSKSSEVKIAVIIARKEIM